MPELPPMSTSPDVLVLGGGAAGTAAALAARSAGATVTLVRAGPGATHMCAGGWNAAPPAPFVAALEAAGHPLRTAAGPLPHPSGWLRHDPLAAAHHAGARLDGGTLVAGIAGLPGFRAAALAALWADAAGIDLLRHATLALDRTPAAGWAPASLAAQLEQDPALLAAPLAGAVKSAGASLVIIPVVAGFDPSPRLLERIAEQAGATVVEALGMPPSLPGLRLGRALDAALRSAGVEVVEGRAALEGAGAQTGAGTSHAVIVTGDGAARSTARTIRFGRCVLATGGYAGGGIRAEPELREPALGCAVHVEALGRLFSSAEPLLLTAPDRTASQPLLEAGVHTDGDGRPLREDGSVFSPDVYAAGAVVAGAAQRVHGLGDAATAGWAAGLRAAR
jgi:glycerol-3-phosphate dehydrogenase subunit B